MNIDNLNPVPLSDPAWLALGNLILPAGEQPDAAISQWLGELLYPLQLNEDFLDKVIRSAQETTARTILSQKDDSSDISLNFFIPLSLTSTRSTWGYFSVMKTGQSGSSPGTGLPEIHFYLYVEGE